MEIMSLKTNVDIMNFIRLIAMRRCPIISCIISVVLSIALVSQASAQHSTGTLSTGLPTNSNTAAYMQSGGEVIQMNKIYSATNSGAIESGVCVKDGGWLTLISPKITKIGTRDDENFDGQGVEAANGSVVNIINGEIYTEEKGANGLWATNPGSVIYMRGGSITTTKDVAHGVDATRNGSIILYDVEITTSAGPGGAPLCNDSEDGTVYATRVTAQSNAPSFYFIGSMSMLQVTDSILESKGEVGVVINGAQAVVTNSTLKGKTGVKVIGGTFTINGGSLTVTGDDVFKVSESSGRSGKGPEGAHDGSSGGAMGGEHGGAPGGAPSGDQGGAPGGAPGGDQGGAPGGGPGGPGESGNTTIIVKGGAKISSGSGDIVNVAASNKLILKVDGTDLTGNLNAAEKGELAVTLSKSTLTGAINGAGISLDKESRWSVTGDSTLTSLNNSRVISGSEITNIIGNGHTVYYDKKLSENKALGGKTYTLANGGKLTPKK